MRVASAGVVGISAELTRLSSQKLRNSCSRHSSAPLRDDLSQSGWWAAPDWATLLTRGKVEVALLHLRKCLRARSMDERTQWFCVAQIFGGMK